MRIADLSAVLLIAGYGVQAISPDSEADELGIKHALGQETLQEQQFDEKWKMACPDYTQYAQRSHNPLSEGPLELPFQRPHEYCRTFKSPLVEKVIKDMKAKLVDKDLARLFENAFPNTLDTTVRWHVDGSEKRKKKSWGADPEAREKAEWEGAHSFIVTGDINAEWLRDSTNQLAQYQGLAKHDKAIYNLILGAINTQVEYVIQAPFCNAFQPPSASRLEYTPSGDDNVHPVYEPDFVFECKYELDSLANFLSLFNQFYASTGSTEFMTKRWYLALNTVLEVIDTQSRGTFNAAGQFQRNTYTFQRNTNVGTETLALAGNGNPLNNNTGLVRSAFRPSDDATILGFLSPANAMIAVELSRAATLLKTSGKSALSKTLQDLSDRITKGIWEHGVVNHPTHGKVLAYEVDGYGSHILMDDANIPSLLSLPLLGFLESDNEIYQNTRKMLLSPSNPYFLSGPAFTGIGGPHIGLKHAWPMSVLVQAMTSDDEEEIRTCLERVKGVSRLGLVHESVNVGMGRDWTRSWFAWANSVLAQTVLDLARRKPEVVFGKGKGAYNIEDVTLDGKA